MSADRLGLNGQHLRAAASVLALAACSASFAQAPATAASAPAVPVVADAVAAPAAPAPMPRVQGGLSGAPTVNALSELQKLGQENEIRKKWAAANAAAQPPAPPAPPPAASAPAQLPAVLKPLPPAEPPVDTSKKVLAIYGPAGAPVADIQLPNATVQTVRVGDAVHGYQVARITQDAVEFVPPRGGASKPKPRTGAAPAVKRVDPVATPVRPVAAVKRNPTAARVNADGTLRVAVGGSFK